MQQPIDLGRLRLTSPVMNAAGPWAATKKQLKLLYDSSAGAVVTKTFTLQPATGNEEPNTYFDRHFSINSVGLKNRGADYFIKARQSLGNEKPIIASIAEAKVKDFLKLACLVQEGGFDAIELNLSCPNLATKEPIAYDPAQLKILLDAIFKNISIPVGVKLPPFVTRSALSQIAAVFAQYPINHLVVLNTYPFAAVYENSKTAIKPNDGIGGLGGGYLKPIALAHVILIKQNLPDVPIVACGGINTKADSKDFIKAGAVATQIGTAIQLGGIEAIDRLME